MLTGFGGGLGPRGGIWQLACQIESFPLTKETCNFRTKKTGQIRDGRQWPGFLGKRGRDEGHLEEREGALYEKSSLEYP